MMFLWRERKKERNNERKKTNKMKRGGKMADKKLSFLYAFVIMTIRSLITKIRHFKNLHFLFKQGTYRLIDNCSNNQPNSNSSISILLKTLLQNLPIYLKPTCLEPTYLP